MSEKQKEERTAEAGKVLSQWWSLGVMMRDRRAKTQHMAIFWVILDCYYIDKGHSEASVRFIRTKLAGRVGSNTTISRAIKKLEDWGYIIQLPRPHKASPARFIPALQTSPGGLPPVTPMMCNALGGEAPVTPMSNNTPVTPMDDNAPVTHMDCNETDQPPAKTAKGVGCTVSPTPVADGLSAPAGDVEFKKARAAYDNGDERDEAAAWVVWQALGPDAKLAAHIAKEAASWALTAKPGQKRFRFSTWLRKEKYGPADRRPTANDNKPKPEPAPTVTPEPAPRLPVVEMAVEIIKADVAAGKLRLAVKAGDGEIVHDEIVLESDNEATQRAGQKRWGALQAAVDLTVSDTVELHGKRLVLVRDPYRPDCGFKPLDDAAA